MKRHAFVFFVMVLILVSFACDGDVVSGTITRKEYQSYGTYLNENCPDDVSDPSLCDQQMAQKNERYILYINSEPVNVNSEIYDACNIGDLYPDCGF